MRPETERLLSHLGSILNLEAVEPEAFYHDSWRQFLWNGRTLGWLRTSGKERC